MRRIIGCSWAAAPDKSLCLTRKMEKNFKYFPSIPALTTWCTILRTSAFMQLVPEALDLSTSLKRRTLIISSSSRRYPLGPVRGTGVWNRNSRDIFRLCHSTKTPTPKSWNSKSSEEKFLTDRDRSQWDREYARWLN